MQRKKRLRPMALHARPGLLRMRTIALNYIERIGVKAGDETFYLIQLVLHASSREFPLVPCGMAIIAEDQLGADAPHFAAGA